MFDPEPYDQLAEMATQVAAARAETALATGAQACDALRAVQKAQDVLDGVHADLLAQIEASDGHTEEGASSTTSWARQELRMGVGETRQRRKAGATLSALPTVAAALADGRIRLAHVYEFTTGITKLGTDVMVDAQHILLPVAEASDPSVLRALITRIHQVLHPEDLDDKYARGMDRQDLSASKCGDGWHITGFLPQHVGAKFHAWLKAVSAAEYEGDDRPPSARRVDAFGRLLDTQTDTAAEDPAAQDPAADARPRGRRHADTRLLILADLETLLGLPGAEPASLVGFGPIGQQLLGYLTCEADLTDILTHGLTDGPVPQANVLNVGRTRRLATSAQRTAVTARQDGTCAAPGCGLSRLEVHHAEWWYRDGGSTDLDNLVGLCSRCHHLVHQNKLVVRTDGTGGFTFSRQNGRTIDDHARISSQRIRDVLATLRHASEADRADGEGHAQSSTKHRTVPRPTKPRVDSQWLTPLPRYPVSHGEVQMHEFIDYHRRSPT